MVRSDPKAILYARGDLRYNGSAAWGVSEEVITSPFQGEEHGFESRTPYPAPSTNARHPITSGAGRLSLKT